MNYLTIVTNFVGEHIGVPPTTLSSLDMLKDAVKFEKAEVISIQGGGDPLYEYDKHQKYYRRLFKIARELHIPIELHTACVESEFPYEKCTGVIYHLRDFDHLTHITRRGKQFVRVVFIVDKSCTLDLIDKVTDFCETSNAIDQIWFRRAADKGPCLGKSCEKYLREGHDKRWLYIDHFEEHPPYFVNGVIHYRWSDISE